MLFVCGIIIFILKWVIGWLKLPYMISKFYDDEIIAVCTSGDYSWKNTGQRLCTEIIIQQQW